MLPVPTLPSSLTPYKAIFIHSHHASKLRHTLQPLCHPLPLCYLCCHHNTDTHISTTLSPTASVLLLPPPQNLETHTVQPLCNPLPLCYTSGAELPHATLLLLSVGSPGFSTSAMYTQSRPQCVDQETLARCSQEALPKSLFNNVQVFFLIHFSTCNAHFFCTVPSVIQGMSVLDLTFLYLPKP